MVKHGKWRVVTETAPLASSLCPTDTMSDFQGLILAVVLNLIGRQVLRWDENPHPACFPGQSVLLWMSSQTGQGVELFKLFHVGSASAP